MRDVVVHYHLFKNAGTTVDHILERNFGADWATIEAGPAPASLTPEKLLCFIRETANVRAVSSHQAEFPVPVADDIQISPILFLRHPIDRIRSAYDFERQQRVDTPGAIFAREHGIDEYIRWRLARTHNGPIHNFHAIKLIGDRRYVNRFLGNTELTLIVERLRSMPFIGLVEQFDDSLKLLDGFLSPRFPNLDMSYAMRNVAQGRADTLEERLEKFCARVSADLWEEIHRRNAIDLALYEQGQAEFRRRLDGTD